MESFETIQNKLLRAISESADREKIVRLWKFWNDENSDFSVSEPVSFYDSERPMTDEEVDEYFKEEVVVLPANLMKMIERGMDDVKNGKVYTEEEIDKMDEEWLK
ncbi:hypothetical protein [Chryseobacterium caseinilyticum]|uniref:Uncharacterized protein n=1 Tax=Chryseobacterium caseinilyticum TaxID=2771428 RepID=A0ABR8Z8G5_9FLAO|nr:hypothetical protein [Chryseobacterium caseinilyticum]MBD8081163.1 hypothetical protein [Chryseobacterium caseinilyticum]